MPRDPFAIWPVGAVYPSRRSEREFEDAAANSIEAFELLKLIDAEFQSDPQATACFDLRIVERVRLCVARRAAEPLG